MEEEEGNGNSCSGGGGGGGGGDDPQDEAVKEEESLSCKWQWDVASLDEFRTLLAGPGLTLQSATVGGTFTSPVPPPFTLIFLLVFLNATLLFRTSPGAALSTVLSLSALLKHSPLGLIGRSLSSCVELPPYAEEVRLGPNGAIVADDAVDEPSMKATTLYWFATK